MLGAIEKSRLFFSPQNRSWSFLSVVFWLANMSNVYITFPVRTGSLTLFPPSSVQSLCADCWLLTAQSIEYTQLSNIARKIRPVADDKGSCFRQIFRRGCYCFALLLSYHGSDFNQPISFLFVSLSNHTSPILLNQDTTRNFKDFCRISQSAPPHWDLGKFSLVRLLGQQSLAPLFKYKEKSAPNFSAICANLRIVWYLRGKLELFPQLCSTNIR